jgi:TonB family protein
MQRAYVFSKDAKSLEILHQIFEELAVTSEQSNELAAAIKKISTEGFDAVLVDCDDLQMATQLFGILRGSTLNHAMTIAVVDGKAGVPTAFRLGAKMVLSKPLSLEQARSTLRSALAVRRRDVQENKTLAAAASAQTATEHAAPHAAAATPGQAVKSELETSLVSPPPAEAAPPAMSVTPAVASGQGAAAAPARESKTSADSPLEAAHPPKPNPEQPIAGTARTSSESKSSGEPTKPQIALVSRQEQKSQPSAPTFAMLGEKQSRSKPGLLPAIVAVLLIAAATVAWMTQPKVRSVVLGEYGQLTHRTTAITPTPPADQSSPDAQAATQATPQTAVPAPAQPAPAAAAAPDPSTLAQGFQDNPPAEAIAPAAAADNAEPIVVPEDLADAHVTHRVAPWYPTKARHAHVKGNVIVVASVGADGTVQSAAATKGNPMLRLAAEEAVKQWQYQPYYQNGQPVPFQTQVTVSFPSKAAANRN